MLTFFKKFSSLTLIGLISLQLLAQESEFDGIKHQLTDREAQEAQKYIHTGVADDLYKEKCDINKDGVDECKDQDVTVMNDTLDAIVPAVSKVYAMILGMGAITGKGSKLEYTDSKKAARAEKKKESEDRNDVCVYIPMATELVAAAFQQSEQNIISEVPDKPATIQRTSLEKTARTHEARSKSATVQATGWYATTACYIAYVSTGSVFDFKMGVKIAGSGLLGTFYTRKAQEHTKYARFIQGIADSMPNAGDCNPHTDTHCFCQEDSSQRVDMTNYTKYCVPKEMQKRKNPATALTCVDSNLKADAECRCKASNSCFNETFKAMGAKLNLGSNLDGFYPNLDSLTAGNYSGATLQAQANGYQAMAKQFLKKNKASDVPNSNLNKSQLEEAKLLAELGTPNNLAAFIASQPIPAQSTLAKLNSGSPKNDNKELAKTSKLPQILMYEQGHSKSAGKTKAAFNPYAALLNKQKPADKNGNIEVLEFAQQAQEEAEINQDDSDSLFEVISQRYRTSGRRNLQVELAP